MQQELAIENSLLGLIQGITEWVPISSEGLVSLVSTVALNRDFEDAIELALWLHIGTAASALVYFKKEFLAIIKNRNSGNRDSVSLASFLILSSIGTAVTGIPLILGLHAVSALSGSLIMILIGALVVLNGLTQINRGDLLTPKKFDSINRLDSMLVGLVQGLSILPGLSRSGLTISFLLLRKYDNENALYLSFLMSVPASLGGVLLILITREFSFQLEVFLGSIIAFLVGILTIHLLLSVAKQIKFSLFLIISGIILILGGLIGLI